MKLTKYEQEILDGKYGEGMTVTMEIQVAIGDTFDADEMVPITRTHVTLSSQAAGVWSAEELLKKGAHCIVPPTVNPSINIPCLNEHLHEVPEEGKAIAGACNEAYRKLGATLTFNCTPYLQQNIPAYGEVVAFSGSSATPCVSSMVGARTNWESSQNALCTAITGMVPRHDLLLDKNHRGQILVDVQAQVSFDFNYQLLGRYYPEKYKGLEIPVFTGIHSRLTPEGFMDFGARLNASGCVSMYHVVGITSKAPTVEAALGKNRVLDQVTIIQSDLEETREHLCHRPGKIDFAMFSCPHLTIRQVAIIVGLVEGKRLAVDTWVLTNSLTREFADRIGYLSVIQRAGGHIVSDACIDVPPCWQPYYGSVGVTDSSKYAYYNEMRDITFIIRPLEESIEAALRGEVLT